MSFYIPRAVHARLVERLIFNFRLRPEALAHHLPVTWLKAVLAPSTTTSSMTPVPPSSLMPIGQLRIVHSLIMVFGMP